MASKLAKQAKALAQRPYTEEVAKDELKDGTKVFLISIPELPGCMAHGLTIQEARASLKDARYEYILSLLEDGEDVPEPLWSSTSTAGAPTVLTDLVTVSQPETRELIYRAW